MKLNLVDDLVLLALDDNSGDFISDLHALAYGMAGAVIMELSIRNRIRLVEGYVRISERKYTGDKLLDEFMNKIIQSRKELKLKEWVEIVGNEAEKIKYDTIDKLVDSGILEKKKDKILWIFPVNKYPAQNCDPENKLRRRLKDIVFNGAEAQHNDLMLMNLIQSCELGEEVYGKENVDKFKEKLKELSADNEITKAMSQSVKEINDALAASLMLLTTSTLLTTTMISN